MAFDQATRNRLSKFVSDTRKLLSDEFAQQMRVKYGLDPATGVVTDIDKLPTMAEGDRQTAQMLRDTLEHYLATAPKRDKKTIASTIDRIVREQAFTVLNRLCAVRMAESRELVIESIAQGTKSKGFQLYARLAGSALGETGEAYVSYLFSLFDELSIDLPVLFDRFSPSGRLFPRESVLIDVLGQINHHELQHLWAEDETIGWIYQYFNSDEERKAMRDVKAGGSAAPRNSRELAVRNQFFTPRYVVEFLTDNTLGRIWYEMTQGQTLLVDNCKYLVRRPDEVFLSHMTSKDQEHPSDGTIAMAELLLSGTEETFPEFNADDPQPMIELAHCVSAYTTMGDRAHEILGNQTLMVRERSVHEPSEIADAVEAAPYVFGSQLETIKTQYILEVLFMTCRSDRHGGDGSVYSESWFVEACNEVRRRVLHSRQDDLSQEELMRQPVFIPYRPMKDPRDIKMLDPACGSMHFGLYAFDLFLSIYEEAWELEERLGDRAFARPRELKSLRDSYGTRERYLLDVPRLIIERNIHGIDIDARAVQIAGLSLWLRAQRAWHEEGVKPNNRPRITRSKIVCAEPMPGESDLLDQFIADHLSQTSEQQAIASIVRRVFDVMQLAGDAGALLKIEEEIAETIGEAKKKWVEGPKSKQLPLFSTDEIKRDSNPRPLLVAGIDNASFWDEIEERIYIALRLYGEQFDATFKQMLFANDASRGFAFIELCRQRYDIVLMNPPFGDPSMEAFAYLERAYSGANRDILTSFVALGVLLSVKTGFIGAITSRIPLFSGTYEDWRAKYLLGNSKIRLLADLGLGVLDDAMVETCAYTIERSADWKTILAFKLQGIDSTQLSASSSIRELHSDITIAVSPRALLRFPGKQINYATASDIRAAFGDNRNLGENYAKAVQGLGTTDDFRFTRLRYEVIAESIMAFDRNNKSRTATWVPYAKGEPVQPFYADLPIVVNWTANGAEVKEFNRARYGSASRNVKSESLYGRPGIVFARRTKRFTPRILPSGCIFSVGGQAIIPNGFDEYALLGLLSSDTCEALVRSLVATTEMNPQFEVGIVSQIPTPELSAESLAELHRCVLPLTSFWKRYSELISLECLRIEAGKESLKEAFEVAKNNWMDSLKGYKGSIDHLDEVVARMYGVRAQQLTNVPPRSDPTSPFMTIRDEAESILIYMMERLLNRSQPGEFFVSIEGHSRDLIFGIKNDFAQVWGPNCDLVWQEIDDLLGGIREWIGCSFFAKYIRHRTALKRCAPICWPVASRNNGITIWFGYQSLSSQSLFAAVNNFLEFETRQLFENVKLLQNKSNRSQAEEAELEQVAELAVELEDFCKELLRIAPWWKPNLNDGVQITAAPLWQFFSLKKWRETLKKTWEELYEGKYDWAHLALTIWPERVVRVAHKDRSIAIAHDLEEHLWHEVEIRKSSKTGRVTTKIEWQPRELSEKEHDTIVARVKSGELGTDRAAPAEVENG
jgi:hypothetical protein